MAARVMVPEMKCELELYEYVLVQTQYVLFTPGMYLVRTIFPEYVLGTYWYVLCLQKYCSGCCFMSYAYGKQYYVCLTCMLWCSNTESVPLWVSNIHDIILVHTQYVLVCTALYSYSYPVPVCTWYVLVRTGSKPVHTKYPVPVMRLTIPDVSPRQVSSPRRALTALHGIFTSPQKTRIEFPNLYNWFPTTEPDPRIETHSPERDTSPQDYFRKVPFQET